MLRRRTTRGCWRTWPAGLRSKAGVPPPNTRPHPPCRRGSNRSNPTSNPHHRYTGTSSEINEKLTKMRSTSTTPQAPTLTQSSINRPHVESNPSGGSRYSYGLGHQQVKGLQPFFYHFFQEKFPWNWKKISPSHRPIHHPHVHPKQLSSSFPLEFEFQTSVCK